MTKVRTTLSGIVLSGVALTIGATPALAHSASGGSVSSSATAAVSKAQKLSKLKNLTEDSNASTGRWLDAMNQHLGHKQSIDKYKFNWHTDYCTNSPDTLPGGYDFKMACWRHDFGYRNYKGLIGNYYFKKNGHKKRVDKALLRDLYSACNYKPWADPLPASERKRLKAACRKAAEKYYGAVSAAG